MAGHVVIPVSTKTCGFTVVLTAAIKVKQKSYFCLIERKLTA